MKKSKENKIIFLTVLCNLGLLLIFIGLYILSTQIEELKASQEKIERVKQPDYMNPYIYQAEQKKKKDGVKLKVNKE